MEFRFGLTEPDMKETGSITKPMVKGGSFMWMVISMMDNGKTIKLQEKEFIITIMGRNMTDNG